MFDAPINSTQRHYARVAGLMYILSYPAAAFGLAMISRMPGSGSFAEQAQRIMASQHLHRAALASLALSLVLIVVLAYSLYVVLGPVSRRVAQLAVLFALAHACVGSVTAIFSSAALRAYKAAHSSGSFQDEQVQGLVRRLLSVSDNAFSIAVAFLGMASLLFFYLFYRSDYIPRALSALGVVASLLLLLVTFAMFFFPDYTKTFPMGWAAIGIAEVATGFWLMLVGIRGARSTER